VQIDITHGVPGLRASLREAGRNGTAKWLDLRGLSLTDENRHRALCHSLTAFGLGADLGHTRPTVAVLDWSAVDECSAESLAFYGVLLGILSSLSVQMVGCLPSPQDVNDMIEQVLASASDASVQWIPSTNEALARFSSLARPCVFGANSSAPIESFCDSVSATLGQMGVEKRVRQAVMGTTLEAFQNVLSHSEAIHAAAAAIILHKRRPPVIQIGISDDGLTIASSVVGQTRHAWLGQFHDTSITETVLHSALTRRGSHERTNEQCTESGGFGLMVKRLLLEARSIVIVRSGAALIKFDSKTPGEYKRFSLDYGVGTQVRIEIRV
jgi:hypothetical protein